MFALKWTHSSQKPKHTWVYWFRTTNEPITQSRCSRADQQCQESVWWHAGFHTSAWITLARGCIPPLGGDFLADERETLKAFLQVHHVGIIFICRYNKNKKATSVWMRWEVQTDRKFLFCRIFMRAEPHRGQMLVGSLLGIDLVLESWAKANS